MTFLYGLCVIAIILATLILNEWQKEINEAKELLEWCIREIERLKGIIAGRSFGNWNEIKYSEEDGWLYNLPEDGQEVLVSWENGWVSTDTFMDDGEDGVFWDSGNCVEEGQAWMPLPESFKGER